MRPSRKQVASGCGCGGLLSFGVASAASQNRLQVMLCYGHSKASFSPESGCTCKCEIEKLETNSSKDYFFLEFQVFY